MLTHNIRKNKWGRTLRAVAGGIFEFGKPSVPSSTDLGRSRFIEDADIPAAVAMRAQQQSTSVLLPDGRIVPRSKVEDAEVQSRIDALEAARARYQKEKDDDSQPTHTYMIPERDKPLFAQYTQKQFYSDWVESVQNKFTKGELVTLRMYPFIPGSLNPPIWYTVHDFQEIRHFVQWDSSYREPRAIGIRPNNEGIYQFACPSALRKLTDHERFLVNIQNQKTTQVVAEAPAEAADNLGSDERPDPVG